MARYPTRRGLLVAAAVISLSATAVHAQGSMRIAAHIAPPPLPVYEEPPLPAPDYIWVPGYWAWDTPSDDYFWVPGTWELAPRPGYLWTPPWWGWSEGAYVFHPGYWALHIGWYGGISYGFGYTGFGYVGGYWNGPHYVYNRAVTHITNVHITNVYTQTIVENHSAASNVSFNGGPGGLPYHPTPAQLAAEREPHLVPTTEQQQHMASARHVPQLFAGANHGAPPVAATAAPGHLSGPGVVRAKAVGWPAPFASEHPLPASGPQRDSEAGRLATEQHQPAPQNGVLPERPSPEVEGPAWPPHQPFSGSTSLPAAHGVGAHEPVAVPPSAAHRWPTPSHLETHAVPPPQSHRPPPAGPRAKPHER